MAKRRVNVQFLGIIGVVAVVVLVAMLAFRYLHKGDPKKYVDLARRLWHVDHNLVDAAANYNNAVGLAPKDLAIRNEFGVLLHELTQQDPAYGGKDRDMWSSVLNADPTNREALQHMMELEVEIVELS